MHAVGGGQIACPLDDVFSLAPTPTPDVPLHRHENNVRVVGAPWESPMSDSVLRLKVRHINVQPSDQEDGVDESPPKMMRRRRSPRPT